MSYLVEANNNVHIAMSLCTALPLTKCKEIIAQLSTSEWCDLCRALNEGDSAKVNAIIGLRAFC